MPEDEFEKETWVYAGRRGTGGKVFYCWASDLDVPESELWTFEKLKAHGVGGLYEVDVLHNEDGPTQVKQAVRFVSAAPSGHPIVDQWRLLDRAAETARLQASKERKAKEEGQDIGDLTLNEVKVMLMNRGQSAAILAMVIRYLGVA